MPDNKIEQKEAIQCEVYLTMIQHDTIPYTVVPCNIIGYVDGTLIGDLSRPTI